MTESAPDINAHLRKIIVSERRQQVWGWVAAQNFERTFYQRTIAAELKLADSIVHHHVLALQGLSLIRRLSLEEAESAIPPYTKVPPLIKLESDHWAEIEELIETINPLALILPPEE